MGARLFIRDSGGVARQVRRLAIRDASGTPRMIKRLFIRDAGGTARLVFAGITGSFVITDAHQHLSDIGPVDDYGFGGGAGGALVSNNLSQGTPLQFDTLTNAGSNMTTLIIGSLVSDPGQLAFTSILANSFTIHAADASYSFAGGEAQWVWAATVVWGGSGTNKTVTVT